MALTDTFVRQVKPTKATGDKHADGGGMYLLVKESGKYGRMTSPSTRVPTSCWPIWRGCGADTPVTPASSDTGEARRR